MYVEQVVKVGKDNVDDLAVNVGVGAHRPIEDEVHHFQFADVRPFSVEQLCNIIRKPQNAQQ